MGQQWDNDRTVTTKTLQSIETTELDQECESIVKHAQDIRELWNADYESRSRQSIVQMQWDTMIRNQQTADMLYRITLLERQNQSCELCGYRFNYISGRHASDGEVKKQADWCAPNKTKCSPENGWLICLQKQERKRKSWQRFSLKRFNGNEIIAALNHYLSRL